MGNNNKIGILTDALEKVQNQCKKDNKLFEFVGSVVIFDPDNDMEVVEDRIFGFGVKETISIAIDDLQDEVGKEEDDFVNW